MKFLPILLFPILALTSAVYCQADTVTLISGEKLEGKVILEDEARVVIDVQISSGITDRKTLDRNDVSSVTKTSETEKTFAQIEALKPGPISSSLEQYDGIIAQLEKFLEDHPKSEYEQVVTERIAAFREERAKVEGGEIKISGTWISKEEATQRKYQISAQLLLEQMQMLAKRGDYIGAMNTFNLLQGKYPGSRAYVKAVPLAAQVLNTLSADIARRIPGLENDLRERAKGLEITAEPQKSQLIEEGKREEAQFEATLQAASKAGLAWPPLISRSMKSLEAIKALIKPAQDALAAIPLATMRDSVSSVDTAKTAFAEKDYDTADAKLDEAKALWAENESVDRWKAAVASARLAVTQDIASLPSPSAISDSTPAPEETPEPVVEADSEKATPFFLTIPGAAVILCIVGLAVAIIMIVGKLKKPKGDSDEG